MEKDKGLRKLQAESLAWSRGGLGRIHRCYTNQVLKGGGSDCPKQRGQHCGKLGDLRGQEC